MFTFTRISVRKLNELYNKKLEDTRTELYFICEIYQNGFLENMATTAANK